MFSQNLAYVALVSSDVAATARVLGDLLGLRRTELDDGAGGAVPVFSVGASALAVFPPGHPLVGGEEKPGVHHIAFGVEDLEAALAAAAETGIGPVEEKPSAGLDRKRRVALPASATVGVRTYLSERVAVPPSQSPFVERIDHLGVASADNCAAIDVFARRLGCPVESQQTDMEVQIAVESFTSDKYGVVYHTRPPVPVGGLRVAFLTIGDCELEFLQNFDPNQGAQVTHGAPGTTKQDQGAIARYIARRGPGLHHVALKSADINGTLAMLAKAGCTMIDRVGRPGSRRALIRFLHPSSLGGILLHFVERP